MSKLKNFLTNPWTIAAVAPIITLFLLKIVDSVTGSEILSWCLNFLVTIFSSIYNFLVAEYKWKFYQLVLLFISAPAIGLFILWVLSKIRELKEELQPEWLSYTKDNFDNVIYKWEWWKGRNEKYQVSQISQHCSKCECHLINGKCPNCNSTFYRYVKPDYEVEALILHRADMMEKNKAHTHNKV